MCSSDLLTPGGTGADCWNGLLWVAAQPAPSAGFEFAALSGERGIEVIEIQAGDQRPAPGIEGRDHRELRAQRTAFGPVPVVAHDAAAGTGAKVRIGYNHRFHPAFQKARSLVDEGALGPLMFLRARYGHGGRTGYHTEWRADPAKSGGGELIDRPTRAKALHAKHPPSTARKFKG